ncbi:MAG: hypothetical protein AAF447_23725 [Myxococcota bacterium]
MKSATIWGHADASQDAAVTPLPGSDHGRVDSTYADLEEALSCCVAQLEAMYAQKQNDESFGAHQDGLHETVQSLEAQVATHLEERESELRELETIYDRGNRLEARARKMVAALAAAIED